MREFFEDIDWSRWGELAWTAALRVVVIIVLLYIALRILQRILEPAIRASVSAQMEGAPQIEIDKRVDTLYHVATTSLYAVVAVVGLLTILPEFGINVGALLAGAGIIGFAIGFGSQSLIKDIIAGLFVLMENQYGKGDIVNLAGVGGTVEDVNLRRTVLRDLDGTVHSIPNGEITVASNLTKARSNVNMIVGVSYSEDLDEVFDVINRTCQEMADDDDWKGVITDTPKVLGVDDFGSSSIDIRVLGETQPIRQWEVARELRKRLKKAFDEAGIEIPYPHTTLVTAGQKAADGVVVRQAPASSEG